MKTETILATLHGLAAAVLPVPFNVVIGCIAGAYASFSFGEKVEPRGRMFQLWFACIIMGCAFTAVTNGVVGYCFKGFQLTAGVQAGIGAIVSCLMRFIIPAIIEGIKSGAWKDWIPFIRKTKP